MPKQHGQQPEDLELIEVIDSRYFPLEATTISATNHASGQSVMAAGPSTVLVSAESSTNRLVPGGSRTPPGSTPSPPPPHRSVDHPSSNARGQIQNFIRRFVPRGRASQTIRNATSPQHSW